MSGKSIGRVAALTSSIILVTGYVLLRGGERNAFPGSKSARIVHEEDSANKATTVATTTQAFVSGGTLTITPSTEPSRALFYGSKSGVIAQPQDFTPPINAPATPTTAPSAPPNSK